MTEKDKLLQQALLAFKASDYNGIALLPTGSGKGKLMIEIAKLLKPKNILYLCNTTLLRDKDFIHELHKWDAAHLLPIMDLQCYQTVCKWSGKHYDLLLGDEFDAALTPVYMQALTNNTFTHKVLVSATLQEDKLRMAKRIAPIIFERKLTEVIADNVLNNIKFNIVKFPLTRAENTEYISYNNRFTKLLNSPKTKHTQQQLTWLQIKRKQFMCNLKSSANVTKWLIGKLEPKHEKILIFCGLSSQADAVCADSYHSQNNNIAAFNRFCNGTIHTLSVVDKVDRGINVDSIRNIILESIGNNKTKITQRVGRGLRLNPDEYLNVYILLPYYKTQWGEDKPTIVQSWIVNSTKEMDLTKATIINYKE